MYLLSVYYKLMDVKRVSIVLKSICTEFHYWQTLSAFFPDLSDEIEFNPYEIYINVLVSEKIIPGLFPRFPISGSALNC